MHPSLYLSQGGQPGGRTIESIKTYTRTGFGKQVFDEMIAQADSDAGLEPFTLQSKIPGRETRMTEIGAHDWEAASRTGQRITYAALAYLLTETPAYLEDATRQLLCLVDDSQWPDWRHEVNAAKGILADHRVGGHTMNVAVALDWLYESLTPDIRDRIRDGLIRKGVDVILESMKFDSHWGRYNNWTALIVAGAGIAATTLGDEHPKSRDLIGMANEWMITYLDTIGPEGEYNESPFYAASVMTPIRYFQATSGNASGATAINATRMREFGHWYAWHILPGDRVVGFGDYDPEAVPNSLQLGAIAALFGDRDLQWFYQTMKHLRRYDDCIDKLLSIDSSLGTTPPSASWPSARLYRAYGNHIISRSSWRGDACVVYGKGKHGWEQARKAGDASWYHLDFDAGQLCIDGFGEALIIDLYNSGGYGLPELDRRDYYGKGTTGHNVICIGGKNVLELGDADSGVIDHGIAPGLGAWWRIDLSPLYQSASSVVRTVIHLLPGTIAVHDSCVLDSEDEVSLRWHTRNACEPDKNGNFTVSSGFAKCVSRIVGLGDADPTVERKEHVYKPPYDVNYHYFPYPSHESYIDAVVTGKRVDFLSLFHVTSDSGATWTDLGEHQWAISGTHEGVSVSRNELVVKTADRCWRVEAPPGGYY